MKTTVTNRKQFNGDDKKTITKKETTNFIKKNKGKDMKTMVSIRKQRL